MLRRFFSPKVEVFELDPQFFPEATQSRIPLEMVLRLGVLPLGFKGKKLNVGFLDPESKPDLAAVRKHLGETGFQRFEIRADQMLLILEARYKISGTALHRMGVSEVHPKIQQYLR